MSSEAIFPGPDEPGAARKAETVGGVVRPLGQTPPTNSFYKPPTFEGPWSQDNCFPESVIPPEAPSEQAWQRFIEEADAGLFWDPDTAPEGRLAAEEAIQLENRGVTAQTAPKPHWHKQLPKQIEFWRQQTVHKNAVAAKLRQAGATAEAAKLEACHSYYTFAVCRDCGVVRKFPNRCDLFYCPECQPGLSNERRKQVEWWTQQIQQPKHVVLTVKNLTDLCTGHVDEFRAYFTKLRRRKFARNWKGGFYSLEITREGAGWHLHLHALIDAKWIDSAELALQWHSVTHGYGRIVKVKDCRNHDYLAEVTKYAVKGSQLASWTPVEIRTYLGALTGRRTFGVFGALYGQRTEFAEFIASLKVARPRCNCGSCNVTYYDEAHFLLLDCIPDQPQRPRAPSADANQPQLGMREFRWPD